MLLSKRSRNERLSFETEYQRIEQEKREQIAAERRKTVFSQPASELAPFELKNEMSPLDYRQYVDHIASTVIDQLRAEGLTDADLKHLDALLSAQKQLDFSDPKVWKVAISLLTDLGLINQTVAAPAAAQVDEMETLDVRTREGRLKAKQLIADGMVEEARPLFLEFCDFLINTYGIEFGPADRKKCTQWLSDNNLLMNASNLNIYRRDVLGLRTNDENLSADLEHADLNDYNTRQAIKRQIHKMKQPV